MSELPSSSAKRAPLDAVGAEDAALVRAMAGGDRAALATLYDRFASLLCAVGVRILGERREAEDIAHDVFIEAWSKASTYDEARGTVRAWLLLRLRSRCLDRMKSAHERRTRSLGDGDLSAPQQGPVLDDKWSGADAEQLHRALAGLPVDQRHVLELSYFSGLSGSEIAERIGVPLGTVKSRVAAALAKLRAEMGVDVARSG